MFGSGASSVMKNNRNMVAKRRSFESISETYHEKHTIIEDKKMTASQFERFKIELKEKRRIEAFKKALAVFVIVFTVATVFILILR